MSRYLGMGKESVYGTPVAMARHLDIASESIRANQNILMTELVATRLAKGAYPGHFTVGGDIEMLADPQNIGLLLEGLFGAVATSGAGPYTHDYTVANTLPSFTMDIGVDDVNKRQIDGVGIGAMRATCASNELVALTWSVIGRNETIAAVGTPTFDENAYLVYHQGTVDIATVTNGDIEGIRLNISNGLVEDARSIGNRFNPKLIVEGLTVEGDMDIRFDDWGEYKRFLSGTTSGTTAGPAIADARIDLNMQIDANYQLNFTIPNVTYDTSEANISARNRIVQNVSFKAFNGNPTCELINQSATP